MVVYPWNKPFFITNHLLFFFLKKCKQIAQSKEEMSIARPHVSDDEDETRVSTNPYI